MNKSYKKLFLIVYFFILSNFAFAQKQIGQIEINPYVRIDWYPQFSYAINPINTYFVNIQGRSWGINLAYKIPVKNSFNVKAGIGYYKYSFNKIHSYNTSYGNGMARIINYPSPLYIIFTSDKYWYHTLAGSIGLEKIFSSKNSLQIITGLNLNNYYTYLQSYHITYKNPDNPITNPYKLKNNRSFGLSANLHADLLKQAGRVSIGPSFIIPVFDIWKQDNTFPNENNSSSRNKWLKGIGIGITINFLIIKQKLKAYHLMDYVPSVKSIFLTS